MPVLSPEGKTQFYSLCHLITSTTPKIYRDFLQSNTLLS